MVKISVSELSVVVVYRPEMKTIHMRTHRAHTETSIYTQTHSRSAHIQKGDIPRHWSYFYQVHNKTHKSNQPKCLGRRKKKKKEKRRKSDRRIGIGASESAGKKNKIKIDAFRLAEQATRKRRIRKKEIKLHPEFLSLQHLL